MLFEILKFISNITGLTQTLLKKIKLKSKHADKPELRLHMVGANIFVPQEHPLLTGIIIDAKIWNTGSPCVPISWSLSIIQEGKLPTLAQHTLIPEQLNLSGNPSVVIRGSNSLDIKSKNTPVEKKPIEGQLLFLVKMRKIEVEASSTKLELCVKDIYGNESVTQQVMGKWLSANY